MEFHFSYPRATNGEMAAQDKPGDLPATQIFFLEDQFSGFFLRLLDLTSLSSQRKQEAQGALWSLCARCECPCSSSLGKQ